MRLLEVSFTDPNDSHAAGLESYVRDLSFYLKSNGIDVQIIFSDSFGQNNNRPNDLIGIKIPRIISKLKLTKIYYNIALFIYLKSHVQFYDVIHINGDNGTLIPFIKGIKTIITLHGSMTEVAEFQREYQQPFKLPSYLMSRVNGLMEEAACKRVTKVVAVSKHVRDYFESRTNRKDINVVNTCVYQKKVTDINRELQSEILKYKNKGKVICLWVGKDPVRKGLEIAKEVVRSNTEVLLYTVGYKDGDKNLNVINLGVVDGKTLQTLYLMSDIFLFPSRYEGFSIAVLECMSNGVIPMTFSIPSTIEIITDGINGFICKDINEMANKLQNVLRHREQIESMKIQAYKRAQDFDCNILYEKVYNIIIEVSESKPQI